MSTASPGLVDEFSSNDDMSTTEERSADADFATDVVVKGTGCMFS